MSAIASRTLPDPTREELALLKRHLKSVAPECLGAVIGLEVRSRAGFREKAWLHTEHGYSRYERYPDRWDAFCIYDVPSTDDAYHRFCDALIEGIDNVPPEVADTLAWVIGEPVIDADNVPDYASPYGVDEMAVAS